MNTMNRIDRGWTWCTSEHGWTYQEHYKHDEQMNMMHR